MTTVASRKLIGTLTEDAKDIEVLGYLIWWSIRKIVVTREDFISSLEQNNLDTKFAQEHNYMSAFLRALKNMQEARIIKVLKNESTQVLCQFTAEQMADDEQSVEYEKEAIIRIDKTSYRKDRDFRLALSGGTSEIVDQLVDHFAREKVSYNSSDISRYIQAIFRDSGDILSMRDQGNIYFVPYKFEDLLKRVQMMVFRLSVANTFITIPMPNVKNSRKLVSESIINESNKNYAELLNDVEQLTAGQLNVTEGWKRTRLQRLQNLRSRLDIYEEVLGEDAKKIVEEAQSLEQQIMKYRKLDID